MPAAPRSPKFRVPPAQLEGALSWVRFNQRQAQAFGPAWEQATTFERVHVCKLAGVEQAWASVAWPNIAGDVQSFIVARYFVLFDLLSRFAANIAPSE